MALHDPDNPESQEMLREADELGDESEEDSDDELDEGEMDEAEFTAEDITGDGDGEQQVTYVQVGGQLIQVCVHPSFVHTSVHYSHHTSQCHGNCTQLKVSPKQLFMTRDTNKQTNNSL